MYAFSSLPIHSDPRHLIGISVYSLYTRDFSYKCFIGFQKPGLKRVTQVSTRNYGERKRRSGAAVANTKKTVGRNESKRVKREGERHDLSEWHQSAGLMRLAAITCISTT